MPFDYPRLWRTFPAFSPVRVRRVGRVITIGVKLTTADQPKALPDIYNVWFSAGIHPHNAGTEPQACDPDAIRARPTTRSVLRLARPDSTTTTIMRRETFRLTVFGPRFRSRGNLAFR